MIFNYKGTVFGAYNRSIMDLMFTKFFGLPAGTYSVHIISLNDNRGEMSEFATSFGWFSPNIRGVNDAGMGFVRLPDAAMTDLIPAINIASENHRYVFCLTKSLIQLLFSKFTETEDMRPLELLLIEAPRVSIGQCWLCGKDIFRNDGRKLICTDHALYTMNLNNSYNRTNNNWRPVATVSSNQPYLKKKLSFGFEFEVSFCDDAVRNEINFVMEQQYGFIATSDATVSVEWKSGIYKGFPPFYNQKNAFDFIDHCIQKGWLEVGDSAGTHLHIATSDPNHPAYLEGAVHRKILNDENAARKLYKFIRYCEIALETGPREWFEEVFGRQFTGYARKFNHVSGLYAGVFHCSERYSWMNFTQDNHNSGRTKTVEFRLPRYIDKNQYLLAVKAGIALYEYSMEILFEDGDPVALAKKLENRVERLFRDKK